MSGKVCVRSRGGWEFTYVIPVKVEPKDHKEIYYNFFNIKEENLCQSNSTKTKN